MALSGRPEQQRSGCSKCSTLKGGATLRYSPARSRCYAMLQSCYTLQHRKVGIWGGDFTTRALSRISDFFFLAFLFRLSVAAAEFDSFIRNRLESTLIRYIKAETNSYGHVQTLVKARFSLRWRLECPTFSQ